MNTMTTQRGAMRGRISLIATLVLLAAIVLPAAAFQLNGQDVSAAAAGETVEYPVILDEAPDGLSGYSMTMQLTDPAIGEIIAVSFPSWATLKNNGALPADSVTLKAADLNDEVVPGSAGILLATLTLRADAAGTTPVTITLKQMDDDDGGIMSPAIEAGSFTVNAEPTPTETATTEPTPTTTDTPAPTADFIAVPASGTAPLSVRFTDLSEGDGISAWAWDFENDGTIDSTEQNPEYTYTDAGTYSVRLVVTGTGGDGETVKTGCITVTGEPVPTPTTTATPDHTVPVVTADVAGDTVVVNWQRIDDSDFLGYKVVVSRSNPDPAYPDDGYLYYITDRETTSATISTSDSYNGGDFGGYVVPGETYYFSVTALYEPYTTVAGNAVQLTFPGGATPTPTTTQVTAPVADFSAEPASGNAPLSVQFMDLTTGEVVTYEWDFDNDGTADSTAQNPHYTYTDPGTYTVRLTVANTGGTDYEIKTDYITVTTAPVLPVAGFSAEPVSGTAPLTVQFTDVSIHAISYAWDFENDGTTDSTEQNPQHTYAAAGTYTVKLMVENAGGSDEESKADYITVNVAAPVAGFTADPISGTAPLSVQFTDQSAGDAILSYTWDFDNDSVTDSTGMNPRYIYAAAGTYTVKLTVANAGGSDDEVKTDYITVTTAPPVADFAANVTSGTAPLSVMFTDKSVGEAIASYAWDFDNDGVVDSTEQNPEHIYTTAGTYTVKLTVANAGGSDDEVKTDYIPVTVAPPAAGFAANITDGTVPLTVLFEDQSTGDAIASYAWDFENDGTVDSADKNPVHTYVAAGTYNVSLTVENAGGSDSHAEPNYITVRVAPPVASFSANITEGYAPLAILFADASTGDAIASYAWDFENDGTVDSADKNPVHVFASSGNFTVNLTVANAGGSDTKILAEYIRVAQVPAPVAAFSANVTTGIPPLTVRFADESTGTGLTSWAWDFNGDGIADSNDQNPVYTYSAPGSYNVRLTVTGTGGQDEETKYAFITVSEKPPAAPEAEFIAKPTSGKAPLSVKFTDKSVGKSITAWAWDFESDGTIDSTGQDPVHTYTAAGKYTVTLTVTNAGGTDTAVKKNYITVSGLAKPEADFKADPTSGNAPLTVKFTDKSSGKSITGWSWDFNNDGTIDSTGQNPTYTYTTAGKYSVRLVVTNAAGTDTEVKSDYITVKGSSQTEKKPVAVIFASNTWGTPPMTVKFADQSKNNPTSRTWYFGDGTSSTEQNPTHLYADPGIYFARLYVENSAGTDMDWRVVVVLPKWMGFMMNNRGG